MLVRKVKRYCSRLYLRYCAEFGLSLMEEWEITIVNFCVLILGYSFVEHVCKMVLKIYWAGIKNV
ncbi:hypothetical protein THOM_1553 [Trachipleistophora hominis]|uniref:Uncharacterized protein n=1 Tax=Trachipleistophora hominis TaxID=72359 RepID=L7JWR9_TRAHO|nr:hypothetical protein THOM_1553 [Trachipleistophora hominis]